MAHNKRSCKGNRDADRAISEGGNNKKTTKGVQKKKPKTNAVEIGSSSQAPQPTQLSQQ